MLKKRLQWLYTAARVRLWGNKYSSSSWSKSLYPCNWKYSERYSSLLVLSGVVRVFWESLSGGLVMILCSIWNSPGFIHCTRIFTFAYSKVKSLCQVLLIWGCKWKCLAHLGGVSQVKILSKNLKGTKYFVFSSPAEMAGLRQYSDYIIGADSVLHESEVISFESLLCRYDYDLSGPIQPDWGAWG